jgi:hypothetical protein
MQAAVSFQAFRRTMEAWLDVTMQLDDPATQTNVAACERLSAAQESAYREWAVSLHTLLHNAVTSKAMVQMKMDAFCQYVEHHLYENTRFVLCTLLMMQQLARFAGLDTAEVDRVSTICQAFYAAIGGMAGTSGTFLS